MDGQIETGPKKLFSVWSLSPGTSGSEVGVAFGVFGSGSGGVTGPDSRRLIVPTDRSDLGSQWRVVTDGPGRPCTVNCEHVYCCHSRDLEYETRSALLERTLGVV